MKAIKLFDKEDLRFVDIPQPEPDGDKVIIKVDKCCICGSDFHFSYDNGDIERLKGSIPGHEYSGIVVDPGANKSLKAGDRVVVNPSNTCDACELCKTGHGNACHQNTNNTQGCAVSYPGAFAEYTAARPAYVFKLSDNVSMVSGALIEPCAVAARSVKLSGITAGDTAVVIGSGMIGVGCCLMAKAVNARVVLIDVNVARGSQLLEQGDIDAFFDGRDENLIEEVLAFNDGKGYAKLFECSGATPSFNNAVHLAGQNAMIIVTGTAVGDMPVDSGTACLKELCAQWVYAYDYADFEKTRQMVENGLIHPEKYVELIGFDQVLDYYQKLRNREVAAPKVVIDIGKTGLNA